MGITSLSLIRINKYIKPNDKLLIIGCQNLYSAENYGQVAHQYFERLGYSVRSLDILGCQGSEQLDLRQDLHFFPEYDIVNDCGSKEHIDGSLYQPFKNIHEACNIGGVMIHENPESNSWPLHGQHYFTTGFYFHFGLACKYELLETTREAAMGNEVDGWNVSAVLMKLTDSPFISEDQFNEIYAKFIFPK